MKTYNVINDFGTKKKGDTVKLDPFDAMSLVGMKFLELAEKQEKSKPAVETQKATQHEQVQRIAKASIKARV